MAIVFDPSDQHTNTDNALSRCDAELRQVAAQSVHQHCPLPDQKFRRRCSVRIRGGPPC